VHATKHKKTSSLRTTNVPAISFCVFATLFVLFDMFIAMRWIASFNLTFKVGALNFWPC
jgi:hypothetical protein